MQTSYKTILVPSQIEIIEKKSRFIGYACPVLCEEAAIDFVNSVKQKHRDATHNVYAYITRKNNINRFTDDGEPSGTAGLPTLDAIRKAEFTDAAVVVTRYFGGTLLGTGGLVRAYSGAVQEGLKNSVILEKLPGTKLGITCDYTGIGKLQYLAGQTGARILDTEYTDIVSARVLVKEEEAGSFVKKVTEATNGRASIEVLGTPYFADKNGELLLFDQ